MGIGPSPPFAVHYMADSMPPGADGLNRVLTFARKYALNGVDWPYVSGRGSCPRGSDHLWQLRQGSCNLYSRARITSSRRRGEEVPLGQDPDQLLGAQGSVLPTDAEAENRQRLRDLSGAFRGLSDSHHQVIVLRELEGLSYAQIGQRLGMSRPMVESTLFRARRRLNEEYQDLTSGRRCAQVQALLTGEGNHALIALGLRQRRKVSRHLAHCQPCRRMARLAGVDERFFRAPSIARRIAGLLPLPWLHTRAAAPAAPVAAPRGRGLGLATRQLESVAPSVDPSAPLAGLGRAL